MLPLLFPVEALALDCTVLDAEVCSAATSVVDAVNAQAGRVVVGDASPRRLRPMAIHRRLLAVREGLPDCSIEGWTAGLYADGTWDGSYGDDEQPGTWSGTYDPTEKTVDGSWSGPFGAGSAGDLFSAYNKQGQVVADLDGGRLIAGSWIREQGTAGVFALLHMRCPVHPFVAAAEVFRDLPDAAPECPAVTLTDEAAVALSDLGITDGAGDPLAPIGVRLIDGDGQVLLSTASVPDALELQGVEAFLDARGIALPRLEVVVPDAVERPSTCAFPIEPVAGIVCRQRPTRTVFDREQPLILDLTGDCVSLDDDPTALDIVDVQSLDGQDIAWSETPEGRIVITDPQPGTRQLGIVPRNGDPIRFTITFRDSFLRVTDGETDPVSEDGGTIALQPLLDRIGGDDPLAPVSVELIGPDNSAITASDIVGDELVVPRAPVLDQGEAVVTPKLLLRVLRGETLEDHVFDVPVNRAPYCRADGPLPVDAESLRVPLDWCVDPEGDEVEVVAVLREDGGEVPFSIEGEHLVFAVAGNNDPVRFTLEMRDTFLNRPRVPPTIGTGTFTITSRDEFDAL